METFRHRTSLTRLAIVAALLGLLALGLSDLMLTQASTELAAPSVTIQQAHNAKAAVDDSVVVLNQHGWPDPAYHVFKEAGGYAVYVALEAGTGQKVAHLNQDEYIACRLEEDSTKPCKTYESDQGYKAAAFSNGKGGVIFEVERTSPVPPADSGSEVGPQPVISAAQHVIRQASNAGAAVDNSVVVLTWDGLPHHALHVFKEGGLYSVYVGEHAGQGRMIAQVTLEQQQTCRPMIDPSEVCYYYQSDHGFVTALHSNGVGGLVLKVKEGTIEKENSTTAATGLTTVNADITITQGQGGLVTISGTGQPGAAFMLTPGNNPQTVVIIGQSGEWQLDVAFVAGDHIIKLQDLDANGVAVEPGASVTITID